MRVRSKEVNKREVIDARRSYLNPRTGLRIFVSPSFPLELGFPRVSARILLTFLFAVDAAIAPQSRESSAFSPSHGQSGSNALACKRRSACPTRKECARGPGDAAPGRFGSQQGSAGTCQRINRRLPGSATTDDSGSPPP